MLHVTSAENSRNIKYVISPVGNITIFSLNPKAIADKEKLVDGDDFGNSIIHTDFKAKDYQSMLSSLFVESDKAQHVININYISYPKTVQKPNKFDVSSARVIGDV